MKEKNYRDNYRYRLKWRKKIIAIISDIDYEKQKIIVIIIVIDWYEKKIIVIIIDWNEKKNQRDNYRYRLKWRKKIIAIIIDIDWNEEKKLLR